MPVDLRALVDTTGPGTTIGSITTIPGGDGQTNYGLPISPELNPLLAYLGFLDVVATDTTPGFTQLKMLSTDLPDATNGLDWGSELPGLGPVVKQVMLGFEKGAITPQVKQTVAAPTVAALLWYYRNVPTLKHPWLGPLGPGERRPGNYDITLNAITVATGWSAEKAFTTSIPQGTWALLGAAADSVTTAALVRFNHPDWGWIRPGLIVSNDRQTDAGTVNYPGPFKQQGQQFDAMSQLFGTPEIPVFTVGSSGQNGLTAQSFGPSADTVHLDLYLHQIA